MKAYHVTLPVRNPSARPQTAGDVLNLLVPAFEQAGWSVQQGTVDDTGFVARSGDVEVIVEIGIRGTAAGNRLEFCPSICGGAPVQAGNGDESEDDQPDDDDSDSDLWTDDDRWTSEPPSITPDGIVVPPGLAPIEQDWKEQLAPFSRNVGDRTSVSGLTGFASAVKSYEDRKGS
jgi:hypothetical protein